MVCSRTCCSSAWPALELDRLHVQVLTHRLVPPNDGGLALGQAVIAALAANPRPARRHGDEQRQ